MGISPKSEKHCAYDRSWLPDALPKGSAQRRPLRFDFRVASFCRRNESLEEAGPLAVETSGSFDQYVAVIARYTGAQIGVGAVCLSLFHPAQASATPADFSVTLEYAPATQCPGAEDLKAAVVARLGYDPFADDAPHHVSLQITRKAGSLDGRIEWRDAERKWAGDQAFTMGSGDCLRLTRTMGLALAVQIQLLRDPNAAPAVERDSGVPSTPKGVQSTPKGVPSTPKAVAEQPGDRPAPGATAPTQEDVRAVVSRPARAPSPGFPPVFALGVGPAIGFGMAPHPISSGRVFGLLAWQHASIQLAVEMSLPATARRADGAGVSEQLLLLGAAGCKALERWSGCVVLNVGRVSMAGQDIDLPSSTHLPFVATGLRAGFSQPLGVRAFIGAHADGLVILTRWTASLDDVPVWTMPRFAAALGIDLGLQFR